MKPGPASPLILVVEDDPGIATLEAELIQDLGCEVLMAASGGAALERLAASAPTLMLLDYSLPDMTGIALLDRVAERGLLLPPFIVATGAGDEHVAVDLMRRGAHNYLIKDHEFLNVLPTALERALRDLELAARLAEAEKRLRLAARVLESTTEAVMVTDAGHRIVDVNPAFSAITGYPSSEVLGRIPKLLLPGHASDDELDAGIRQAIETEGHWRSEVSFRRKGGEIFTAWVSISLIEGEAGQPDNIVTLFSDISSVKEMAERLDHLAHHDPLTGLPNRLLFNARLKHGVERAQRSGHGLGVLFLDLDHFKEVNDRLGHAAGDELLRLLAKRMSELLREEDTLARLGGDEFVFLIEDAANASSLSRVVEHLLALFPHPVATPQGLVQVSASIGGALYASGGDTAERLLARADAAMYAAKEAGRHTYVFQSG